MTNTLKLFNTFIESKLGVTLRRYQEYVAKEILDSLERGCSFIVVSMPTGSGKTLLEMLIAHYFLQNPESRILVIEPTRFLCDQMYSRLWSKVFGDRVGKEYEGECVDLLNSGKKIVIATPQTALKCVSYLESNSFDAVIIDEVHHAFGGRYYAELITTLRPRILVGFTALLPSYRLFRLDPRVENLLGKPLILAYDFKKLTEIDSAFEPPKAIADLFDAEMIDLEAKAYEELFTGRVVGDPRTVKHLEIALARYGSKAFCESFSNAVKRSKLVGNSVLEELCTFVGYSHKARTLLDVLRAYDVRNNDVLKPVLVFTSRKATAYEFREAIVKELGLRRDRVEILTSDMNRAQRLELIRRAKEGFIDVIVSTLVGEEGIDIPEAGLLVMTDVPKSPLRFYQRLGRLIRLASPRKLKYLAIVLTPKTREYLDLEEALWNLYSEGVDVSYIIVNVDAKGPTSRVIEILEKFSTIYNDIAVPYTLITQGRELSNPLNYLVSIAKQDREFLETLREFFQRLGVKLDLDSEESIAEAIFKLVTTYFLRMDDKVKKALDGLSKLANRGSFVKELSKAMRAGKVFYIYDVDKVAWLIAKELKHLYNECLGKGKRYCVDSLFRLDKKWVLRLYTRLFLLNHIEKIGDVLQRYVEDLKKDLERVLGKKPLVYVKESNYNPKAKMLAPRVHIHVDLGRAYLYVSAQINYYDIAEELNNRSDVLELIELNLRAIGYKALDYFIEYALREQVVDPNEDKAMEFANAQGIE